MGFLPFVFLGKHSQENVMTAKTEPVLDPFIDYWEPTQSNPGRMDESQEKVTADKTEPVFDVLIDRCEPTQSSPERLDAMPTLKMAEQADQLMLQAHSLVRVIVAKYRDAGDRDVKKVAEMISDLLAEARALQDQVCMRLDG
jgi:hypothetical protein